MTVDLIKFAYVAGEISPSFLGRTDLEKYDLGMAQVDNWFVDYRGGLSTRAGLEFIDYIKYDERNIKFARFSFSPDIANTNVVMFGHEYIRFLQDGAYVLEDGVVITGITQANPGVITAVAHGFSSGDWVKVFDVVGMPDINGQLFQITVLTANTFSLQDAYGANFSTAGFVAYVSGGSVARVYTLASPYDADDLGDLRYHQVRDTLRLTHFGYKTMNLVRNDVTDWVLSEEEFDNVLDRPTGVTVTASAAGSASVAFVVTAVFADGSESLPSEFGFGNSIVNYTTTAGQVTVTWTPVAGARSYNIYRTRVAPNNNVSRSFQMGYAGRSTGAHFVDTNIIPDFARTPPMDDNPFADGAITQIDVTAQGVDYPNTATITINDPTGTGFQGYLVIATPSAGVIGPIAGVVIVKGGQNYTNPTVVLGAVGAGAGATFDVEVGPATGNNPFVGAIFQQRQCYGATLNQPLGIFGSRPGRLSNFGTSEIVVASDSFEFELDSEDVSAIRHMVATRGGLLLFNQSGIYQLAGVGGAALTPTNALAEPHAYKGATKLPPIKIDADILYCDGKSGTGKLLTYDDRLKVYSGTDVSLLSNHLINARKQLVDWSFADEPFKIVYGVRSDGIILCMTILKEQNVFAWSRLHTQGLFTNVLSIQEDNVDTTYVAVKRYIGGRWRKYLEKFRSRQFDSVEDAFCVDSGLALGTTLGLGELTIELDSTTEATLRSDDGAAFAPGDVGKFVRAGYAKFRITAYVDAQTVTALIINEPNVVFLETGEPLPVAEGDWTIDGTVTVLRGLFHLEGQTVSILADGNVIAPQIVSAGTITLPAPASRVVIGLKYRCVAQTLPPIVQGAVIEPARKRIVGVAIRFQESRGLLTGARLEKLYALKERTNEAWGEPTRLLNGVRVLMLEPHWNVEGQTYFVQDDPLPATLLGHVVQTDVGDNDAKD